MTSNRTFLVGVVRPSGRRRLFVVPLVVLSVVLVALVVAIVVVLVVRNGAGSGGAAGRIDRCVVGSWRVATHREQVTLPRFGVITFTGVGDGASVRLNSDGTGVTDYGTGTRFDGVSAGHQIRLDVTGTVTYRYAADDGTVSYRDLVSTAKGTVVLDGGESTQVPFAGTPDPADYQCSSDRLVFRTRLYQTTFTRVGR